MATLGKPIRSAALTVTENLGTTAVHVGSR